MGGVAAELWGAVGAGVAGRGTAVQITQRRLRGGAVGAVGRPGCPSTVCIARGTRPVGVNLYPLRGHGGSPLFSGRGLVAPRQLSGLLQRWANAAWKGVGVVGTSRCPPRAFHHRTCYRSLPPVTNSNWGANC